MSSSSQAETDVDWDLLAAHVEGFLEEWEANGYGPQLGDHLPKDAPDQRPLVLVELIKVDLEYRHSNDGPALRLEDYAAEYPELTQPNGIPDELIYEEYHARTTAGESVDVGEYFERFPGRADDIRRVFHLEGTGGSAVTGADLCEAYKPGDHIGDFYLMSTLGTGAFGSVFLARQESMQRMVALKISGDKGTEGQTLAQLDHPNIVRVYDQVCLTDQNLRLLYMQFAAGGTLQAVVRASKTAAQKSGRIVQQCVADALAHTGVLSSETIPLKAGLAEKSWAEVTCQLGKELAYALDYAHSQGILHRDVKPANVLLAADGTAKLADFNISFGSDIEGDDAAASFGGSMAYMSPEQLAACDPNNNTQPTDLDARSDIFSLGILLWELMYGSRPFPDETIDGNNSDLLAGLIELRQAGVSDSPQQPVNAMEERLFMLLKRCLAPNPDDRYQCGRELARDLELTLEPRVAQLMQQSQTGWRRWAQKWPLAAFLVAAIGPHTVAAVFNYFYNDVAIQKELPASADAFFRLVVVINALAFSVGFAFCIGYSRSVMTVLGDDSSLPPARDAARLRSFQLSRFVTVLGITEWIIAGLAYPISLQIIREGDLEMKWHILFIGSFLICGLVAAAYPFFLSAALCIRAFLPKLLRNSELNADDTAQLQRLSDQSTWSLYFAGGVPALGIMILLTTPDAYDVHHEGDRAHALEILSVLGAVGFAITLSLAKSLQSDIEALLKAGAARQPRA